MYWSADFSFYNFLFGSFSFITFSFITFSLSCRPCPSCTFASMSSASSVFRPYGLQTPETGLLTFHPTPYTLHPTPSTLHPPPYTLLRSSRRPVSGVRCPISPISPICLIVLIGLVLQQILQNLLCKFGAFKKKWYICSRVLEYARRLLF